jgi:hypothetical protein
MNFHPSADEALSKPSPFLFALIGITLCLLTGCIVQTETTFVPIETSQKVILFERYSITIWGNKERSYDYIVVQPDFLVRPTDTAMAYTVPRLAIDSISFESPCLGAGNPYCLVSKKVDYAKLAPYQIYQVNVQPEFTKEYKVPYGQWSEPESDLKFSNNGGFIDWTNFPCDDFLRNHCSKLEVFTTIYARLLDRRTNKVLDSTVRKVPYVIKAKSHLQSVGDF